VKARANFDLSGRWTGIFNYPSLMPPIGFEAILSDVGGAIGGTVSEQDDDPHGMGGSLHSFIEGHREGHAVTFTKMYDDLDRMPDAVFYSGTIEPDGNEISGRWEIPGAWAGTFLMIRDSGAAETAEEEASEKVPADEEVRPL
jgi:hypothetical protein